ncbi:MAG: 4Fe-4S binding protein, partial [Acidaminococcaceae bacterium]|nr:4Fe-4S binding protein [Acidaminococcaceae bacterium]
MSLSQPRTGSAAASFCRKISVFWLAFFLRCGIIQNIVFAFIEKVRRNSSCLEGNRVPVLDLIKVDQSKCVKCGLCVADCPACILDMGENGPECNVDRG